MRGYLVRRVGSMVLVLFALSIVAFGLVRVIPGDPTAAFVDPNNPDVALQNEIRSELGLDKPWPQQYVAWLGSALQGDFGESLTRPIEVGPMIEDRLPITLELAFLALFFGLMIGIPAGVWAASKPGGLVDWFVRSASFVGLAIPAFVIGTAVILINSKTLKWNLIGFVSWSEDPWRHVLVLLTPAIVLSLPLAASLSRFTRGAVVDAMEQDFVRTARAKGTPRRRILLRHAFRNALVPVTTVAGVQLAALIGGTVIVEQVFALPGMGSMLLEGINGSDYPIVQACVLVLGTAYVLVNFGVDLLYPWLDPRIRAGGH